MEILTRIFACAYDTHTITHTIYNTHAHTHTHVNTHTLTHTYEVFIAYLLTHTISLSFSLSLSLSYTHTGDVSANTAAADIFEPRVRAQGTVAGRLRSQFSCHFSGCQCTNSTDIFPVLFKIHFKYIL